MYKNTLYRSIDKIINKLNVNGFKSITYGTEKDLDFTKKDLEYPLAHIVMPGGVVNEITTDINFIIIVADKLDKTHDDTYKEYGNDNSIDIQQDLMVRITTTLMSLDKRYLDSYDAIDIGYDFEYNAVFDTFKEDLPELLAGFIFNLTLRMPNMNDDCQPEYGPGVASRPQNYGTSGTSGTNGTSGIDGTSGTSGRDGFVGSDGQDVTSGT